MVKCGNGVCLLLSVIVVMVHGDAGKTTTAQKEEVKKKLLANVEAFPEFPHIESIPSYLNFTDWDPEDPEQKEKIQELLMRGMGNLRRENNITGYLHFSESFSAEATYRAQFVCELLANGTDFDDRPPKDAAAKHLDEYIYHYTGWHGYGNSRPTSEIVASAVQDMYNRLYKYIKEGGKREFLPGFYPHGNETVGMGLSKVMRPNPFYSSNTKISSRKNNAKISSGKNSAKISSEYKQIMDSPYKNSSATISFYVCVLYFANDVKTEYYNDLIKKMNRLANSRFYRMVGTNPWTQKIIRLLTPMPKKSRN